MKTHKAARPGRLAIAITLGLVVAAHAPAEGFTDIFEPADTGPERSAITFSGAVGATARIETDADTERWQDVATAFFPYADLSVRWDSAATEALADLTVDAEELGAAPTWEEVIRRAVVRRYLGWGRIEAGVTTTEWGTADGVHAVDPFSARDLRTGVIDDPAAMKIPQFMAALHARLGPATLDAVWAPYFEPDRVAAEGRWSAIPEEHAALFDDADQPDTRTIDYGQIAGRLRSTLGAADLGLIYAYVFHPAPGLLVEVDPATFETTGSIRYTRFHLYGAEAAIAAGPVRLAVEAAYRHSEDADGTDPSRYNSTVSAVVGADLTVPGTDAFAGMQWEGRYVFFLDADDPFDVNVAQSVDGAAFSQSLYPVVEVPLFRDRVTARVGGAFQVESREFAVFPSLRWDVDDAFSVSATSRHFGEAADGPDGPFSAWSGNHGIEISAAYLF